MDMTGATTTGLIDGGDGERRLQETAAEASSEFEKSTFYGKGATAFLFLFSARVNQLFHWLRMRIFWCLPLRMLL